MVMLNKLSAIAVCSIFLLFAHSTGSTSARELRVCADPNNLPFSNAKGEGFENKIVELLARDLDATLVYVWWPQRRGFIRNTLKAGQCDVISGIASGVDMVRATRPYYRSGYVFVTRSGGAQVRSFDDPILQRLRIGVSLVGEDGSSTPPGHALAKRGIIDNVRGYMIYGDYRSDNPAGEIIDALVAGEIDVAIVWGPLAGYAARGADAPLEIVPVQPKVDGPRLPMVFDISMGVRREDRALRDELDTSLVDLQPEIGEILDEYDVPRFDDEL